MKIWRVGSAVVAAAVCASVLTTPAIAAGRPDTQVTKRVQVQLMLLSAKGTITTSVEGSYDHQYIYVEDPDTGEVKRSTTASMNSTVSWTAPKQELAGIVFGAQTCDNTRLDCSIPVHKVTGTAQGSATASYADGTSRTCTINRPSLVTGNDDLFSDSSDNTLGIHMLGAGGKNVKIWMGGAYPVYGLTAEECPGMAGLKFTEKRDVAQTIPVAKLTGAKIGKPFTLTLTTVTPITGKSGDAVIQVGTVTETTTLKVKVTSRF